MEIRKRKPIGKKNIKYIEELYATYSRRMFFIARKYVQNSDFAEDVVQSAFEKVLAYPDGILKVPRDEVFYFLSTVLRHEALDIIKMRKIMNMNVLFMMTVWKEILLKIQEIIIFR